MFRKVSGAFSQITRRHVIVGGSASLIPFGLYTVNSATFNGTLPLTVATCDKASLVTKSQFHKDDDRVFDVAVVGGGIVGAATAREIIGRFPNKSVILLEKEAEVGLHQSGHNSGVIHAGIYYAPGSTMAKCCVKGAAMMYEYCEKKNIPHEKTGKLICAPTEADAYHLAKLKNIGDTNGVRGLKLLTGAEVQALEPNVVVHSGLYSPDTGIADFGEATRQMALDVSAAPNSEVKVQFNVIDMHLTKSASLQPLIEIHGVELGQSGPVRVVRARNVITCAGLHADKVASYSGGAKDPKVVTFRGTYYQMKPEFANICTMNVYPTPSGGGIPVGVHFTPTVNIRRGQQLIVGPGACVCFDREAYSFTDVSISHMWKLATHMGLWKFATQNWDLAITEMYRDLNKNAFMDQARKLIPSVTDDMVEESFAGVMSQVIDENGKPEADFIYERKMLGGTTLNVRSSPTPACTASLSLAEEIVDQASEDFGWSDARGKLTKTSPFWE
eukprot:m.262546 g.262546  ORF g.262546 m.262546 type:complete len:501 (-) comp46085_c0_seq1:98-1600(-)